MTAGIGSDFIGITRIDRTLSRSGDRSLRRVFTETECRRLPALDFAGARLDLAGAQGNLIHFRLFEEPAA
jgi:phosphopantetheinyl transferase (holo-ACP synthase)